MTFLAQLDAEAARQGVQLDLYEPVSALAPASPMEAAGLKAQKVLLTARGSYPSLLAFVRATEKLSLLVSQSGLSFTLVEPAKAGAPSIPQASVGIPPTVAKAELKIILAYYKSVAAGESVSEAAKN